MIHSKTKKTPLVDFDRQMPRDTSHSLIKKDIVHNIYDVSDKLVKNRTQKGLVELDKLLERRSVTPEDYEASYDSLRASKQLLKLKKNCSRVISFNQQSQRKFSYLSAALESERNEKIKSELEARYQ